MLHTILGAGGIIGKETCRALHKRGLNIRLVSRSPRVVSGDEILFPADLRDRDQVVKAVADSHTVYLTAGLPYNHKIWREQWPLIMHNVINACALHKTRLVFFDNVYMIDPAHMAHIREDAPYKPVSRKGRVRYDIVRMLRDAVNDGSVTAAIARAADFYGPENDKSILIELVFKNLYKKKAALWPGDADKKHNFTYTPDAGEAMALIGTADDTVFGKIWHVPSSQAKTGREWVTLIAETMQRQPRIKTFGRGPARFLGMFNKDIKESVEMMYQFENDYFLDSAAFEKHFNFKAMPAEKAVEEIVKTEFSQ